MTGIKYTIIRVLLLHAFLPLDIILRGPFIDNTLLKQRIVQ